MSKDGVIHSLGGVSVEKKGMAPFDGIDQHRARDWTWVSGRSRVPMSRLGSTTRPVFDTLKRR